MHVQQGRTPTGVLSAAALHARQIMGIPPTVVTWRNRATAAGTANSRSGSAAPLGWAGLAAAPAPPTPPAPTAAAVAARTTEAVNGSDGVGSGTFVWLATACKPSASCFGVSCDLACSRRWSAAMLACICGSPPHHRHELKVETDVRLIVNGNQGCDRACTWPWQLDPRVAGGSGADGGL